ncbi:MAG: ribonuclease [Deferribacteres bacterium]|jgi:ribonuclease HII|nr:ribonuclease [Deferribacteres bacterium]
MLILGVDEVGRGCLAGPVVACACLFDEKFSYPEIKDSKKLSEKKRESLYNYILSNCIEYSFGVVCSYIIDRVNILNATKQAMQIAISGIKSDYDKVVIDAVKLKNLKKPSESPVKAEDKYLSVAAASILAKVYRDRLMKKLHIYFPEYLWYKNKGYGTKEHIEAIKRYGVCDLHRRSFLGEIV